MIFLFMYGGPSHVDTFDYKPKLYGLDGKTIPVKTFGRGGKKNEGRVVGPKWAFRQYGQCGKMSQRPVSEPGRPALTTSRSSTRMYRRLADPRIGDAADELGPDPQRAALAWARGSNYGLGSENENLPGFVVMLDPTGGPISGAKNWSSGYMPAAYQGTVLRSAGVPILDLAAGRASTARARRRRCSTRLREYNDDHLATRADNSNLAARIASYELAYPDAAATPPRPST